jgi:RNA polymerase sigma-70 factor (ECF subfamily)
MTAEGQRKLSCIDTSWATINLAHQGQGDVAVSAQRRLLLRYYRPMYSYLRAMVRDEEAAEELTHEFVVRFLRGDFRSADPARGRFRDLLKLALRRLAIDYWKHKRVEKKRAPLSLPDDRRGTPADGDWRSCPPPPLRRAAPPDAADRPQREGLAPPELDETGQIFIQGWRAEMLREAWRALAQFQERGRCSYLMILRLRADLPEAHSAELAQLAGARLGKPISEAAFRQLLRRAREKFAELLVAAVARTLPTSDPDAVEEELLELDLLRYCRRSVTRLRQSNILEHGGPG